MIVLAKSASLRNRLGCLRGLTVTVHLQMPNGEDLRVVFTAAKEIEAEEGIVRGTAADYPMSPAVFSFVRSGIAGQIDLPAIHCSWNIYHREQAPLFAEEIDTIVVAQMQCGTCAREGR